MSVDYRIKAYPTDYRGRMYRSRLEARWAAFFDKVGWRHEYEPFDLGEWSPDFKIDFSRTENSCWAGVLVEVKPISVFDEDVAAKMVRAAEKSGHTADHGILLVGTNPLRDLAILGEGHIHTRWLGWWLDGQGKPDLAAMYWNLNLENPTIRPEIFVYDPDGNHEPYDGLSIPTNDGVCVRVDRFLFYPEHVDEIWADATNLVQWKPVK